MKDGGIAVLFYQNIRNAAFLMVRKSYHANNRPRSFAKERNTVAEL
jgi:hypothetical protein